MPAVGRKPAPVALAVLNGRSPGRDSGGRPLRKPPQFVRAAPEPPESLDGIAREEWDRIVPELARLRLVKVPSLASLTAHCETWSVFVRATQDVHEHGLTRQRLSTFKDGSTREEHVANPAVAQQMAASKELRAWCAEFGLTPTSEGRVSIPESDDGGSGDFDG